MSWGQGVGNIIQFRRPVASHAVITKLVELGYLQPGKRHNNGTIENALARLKSDLCRDGVVRSSDTLNDISTTSDEGRQDRPS
jgi:hypothetical protein